jgi:Divergent InlB B-repeat domain
MPTIHSPARRSRNAAARHVLSAVLAVAALSACSGGKKSTPTRVTEPAPTSVALNVAGSGSGSGRVISDPAGVDCALSAGSVSGACAARFAPGTVVTLQTQPGATSVFLAFGGDCAMATCQTTMEVPRSVTATFVPNYLSIVANAASVGGGRIVSAPAGIDCILNGTAPGTGACSTSFPVGTDVTLTQEPVAGATFVAWSANCTGNPCMVTMGGQRIVDATFRMPQAPGSVAISGFGAGSGSVTSVPEGIACTISAGVANGSCTSVFAAGIAVAINAVSSGSGSFTGFSGACSGTTCNATVVPGATTTVGVGFSAASMPATLNVTPSPASRGGGTITSSPAGINCTISNGASSGVCSVAFATGTFVSLTQIPVGASLFQGWSGDCAGNPCQLTMSQPRVAELTYRVPPAGIVAVNGTGTGTGSVTSSPSGISCTVTAGVTSGVCSATFDAGASVTLIGGSSNSGSFDGFTGACTGGNCVIAVSSGVTSAVSAAFTAAPQRLTVAAGAGSAGGGIITSSPTGVNCVLSGSTSSGTCTAYFAAGTLVTLQETTTGNAVFAAWGGDCASTPCQLTMSQGRTALAVFQTQGVTVTGGGTGNGLVTSVPAGISCTVNGGVTGGTCATTFAPNTVVSLTSTPSGLSSFSGYTGGCSGTTCTITMVPGNTASVTASFAAPPTLSLSAATGSQGGGTLSSSPSGLTCTLSNAAASGTCTFAYALNTSVTVTQSPTSGSVFMNWAGACTGTGACVVPLSQSRIVQALYRIAVPGSITILSGSGTGNGSVSSSPGGLACAIANGVKSGICRAIFPVGSTVTLLPIANSGYTFTGFGGSCSGMTCVMTVPENGDLTVTANFTP